MRHEPPTTPFTSSRGFARNSPPRIFSVPRSEAVSPQEALSILTDLVLNLQPDAKPARVKFYAGKFIDDVLDYCNRHDFPVTLLFTAAELVAKRFEAEKADELTGTTVPLKRVKQDDTEFEFAVENVSTAGLSADADFETIKPRLNMYRRMRAW